MAYRDGNGESRLRVAPWVPADRPGDPRGHTGTAEAPQASVDDLPEVEVTASIEPVPADRPPEAATLLRPVRLDPAGKRRGRWWFLLVPAVVIVLLVAVAIQWQPGPQPWRPALPEMTPQVVLPELSTAPSAGSAVGGSSGPASPPATRRTTATAAGRTGQPGAGRPGPGTGGTGTAAPGPSVAAAVQPGSILGADGRCLEAEAARPGAAIRPAECAAVEPQRWSTSDGTLRVQGFCLDVFFDRRDNGAEVLLYDCHGGGNQQWRIDTNGWVNPQSGRCLTAVPAGLVIADCTGAADQRWSLT